MYRYFKRLSITNNYILSWKSKRLSDGSVKSPSAPNNFLNLSLDYFGTKTRVEFKGNCLKQDKITYTHGKTVNR